MSLRQYRALAAVGEHRSFARAGAALNLSQSAISMQIAALEQRLGATLFDRSSRPPALTRAGEIALRHARVIVEQEDEIREAVAEAPPAGGVFRLGVIPTALTSLMPRALMLLRERHPDVVVSVVSDLSGPLVEMAARGEVDAALASRPRPIDPPLDWREIARQQVVAIAPPDSPATDLKGLFRQHRYIRFNRNAWVAPLIEERLRDLGLTPQVTAEIQSIDAIHLMVGLGFGASILPNVGALALGAPPLKTLPVGPGPLHRAIGLVARRGGARRHLRRVVGDAFADAARGDAALAAPESGA